MAKSSLKVESGAGAFAPCVIAAAMTACAAASVPGAAGPLPNVESFGALASLEEGAEWADAIVPAGASRSLAAPVLPVATAGPLAAVDVPGIASVRMLTACGVLGPGTGTVAASAAEVVVVSSPTAGAGAGAMPGGTAAAGGSAGSRFAALKIVVVPLALASVVDAAAVALGTGPCALLGGPLEMAAVSATAAAKDSVFAGGGAG